MDRDECSCAGDVNNDGYDDIILTASTNFNVIA
ncbi:MAG: FG-GAP repeat protein [Ignavibacteria bacterium]|nr:FG-GAP repeat protein [Ignavibacteria bacterium]